VVALAPGDELLLRPVAAVVVLEVAVLEDLAHGTLAEGPQQVAPRVAPGGVAAVLRDVGLYPLGVHVGEEGAVQQVGVDVASHATPLGMQRTAWTRGRPARLSR
jgi:hypothetical protein